MSMHPRVLIVDDEAPLRRQVMVGLAQHGFEVDECDEGFSALSKIKAAESLLCRLPLKQENGGHAETDKDPKQCDRVRKIQIEKIVVHYARRHRAEQCRAHAE